MTLKDSLQQTVNQSAVQSIANPGTCVSPLTWKVFFFSPAARDYDHKNADCFVCSILTHGDQTWSDREYDRMGLTVRQDLLFGTDGKAVTTRTVVDLFNDLASPGLRGKPRLFFLQVSVENLKCFVDV